MILVRSALAATRQLPARYSLILVLLLVPTVLQLPTTQLGLRALGLVHQPEDLIELGFTRPGMLGLDVYADGTVILRFTLASRDLDSSVVRWHVVVRGEGAASPPRTAVQGKVVLHPGRTLAQTATVRLDCRERTQVSVVAEVTGRKPLSIHMWVLSIDHGGRPICAAP